MENSYSDTYKAAGVDITAGYRAVELIKRDVERTRTPGVIGALGGFGGLFCPDLRGLREPVLVSGTDGVGTKLRLAFALDRHDTIGQDCVAMCVNDIACSLARPLFFLDYIACGKTVPEKIAAIVKGVADGCALAGCALIGGETAEMPGFYREDEYDLAGFATGLVDKSRIPDPARIRSGDTVIALPSSGLHSNGFSLVRRVFSLDGPDAAERLAARPAGLGTTLGAELLTPTRIYVKAVLALAGGVDVLGVSHITGGGFYENIPRMLPPGKRVRVDRQALRVPPVFSLIQDAGGLGERDMFNTFNMGAGMAVITRREDADAALSLLAASGEAAFVIGRVEDGAGVVFG